MSDVGLELHELENRLHRATDVHEVKRLQKLPSGRFTFLIETPFITTFRFAVGTTDFAMEDIRLVSQSGALWTAEEAFESVTNPGGADV